MKKVFPLIIILVTLSVLGIIFIQMSWIHNSVELRRQQREQDMAHAITQIQTSLHDAYLFKEGNIGFMNEESRRFYLSYFTVDKLSEAEVAQKIDTALKRYNIREEYEYAITNIFQNEVMSSDEYNGTQNDYEVIDIPLTIRDTEAKYFEMLHLYLKEKKNFIIRKIGWYIAGSILFTIIIISAFYLTVRTMFNQKKLSEIKSDFINNMTHELKTPLATISLAIDALTNEKVIHDTDKIRYYSGMIKDENKRMNKQVEKILQSARIEKQDIKLNIQELNAHEIVQKVADNVNLQILDKNGTLKVKTKAERFIIEADEVHFSNVVFNLLDNAIKYSKEDLAIQIITKNDRSMFVLQVKDNGIGMNKETQSRVFEKFYRAHTGNLHNVKGFGLGLSYVKAIVEAHGGKMKVDSVLGKGSTFSAYFPLKQ